MAGNVQRQNGDLLLQGAATDQSVCEPRESTLEDLFGWSAETGLAPEFVQQFGDIPYVVVDENAFAALVDEVDGVLLNGARLDGAQVLAVLRTLYGNPAASLATQEQFVIALGNRASSGLEGVDLNRLIEHIPENAFSSVAPQELLTTYLRLQPLNPNSILVWAPIDVAGCD